MSRSYALLIGINKYPMIDPKYALQACIDDATLVKSVLLSRFGFLEEDIVELYDAAATQKAIFANMQRLVDITNSDDRVYFHFSGHGSTMPSREEDSSEGTAFDSTIMTYDSGRDAARPNLDITDDEIGEWLQKLTAKTQNIALVFDCCHSGTITRDPFASTKRAGPAETRSISEMGLSRRPGKPRTRGQKKSFLPPSDHYVVISGCRDNEESNEYLLTHDGVSMRHGALTYWMAQALLASKPGTTYQDIFDQVSLTVNSLFPLQHPQIEGRRDRVLLGTDTVAPLKYFTLSQVQDGQLTLAGGAAHGLELNSEWAVYPAGTNCADDIEPLARIRLDSLEALSSKAVIITQSQELTAGCRCVLESTPGNIQPLAVDHSTLPSELQNQIASAIESTSLLCLASTPEAAELQIKPDGDQFRIIAKDGTVASSPHDLTQNAELQRLVENLETLAKARNVRNLHNPDSGLKAEFLLYRRPQGGEWTVVGENTDFVDGDNVAFEFTNLEDRSVFLSIMDIGLSGRVTPFFPPNKGTGELIAAGNTIKIGFEGNFALELPSDYHASSGRETFKAIITSAETDFSFMQQSGTRSADGLGKLQELFSRAGGRKTRELVDNSASAKSTAEAREDWTSINRSCELHAR